MFVGIDLGTSKSVVALLQNGKQDILINGMGQRATPNLVAFNNN